MRCASVLFTLCIVFSFATGQNIEKVVFAAEDSLDGYYLAIRPRSNTIKGTVVLFNSFAAPEQMLPETRLHNVAYVNNLLMIAVSMKQKLYADSASVERLNAVLNHVISKYAVDTSKFVLAGYDFAGNIALRYTELTREFPARFAVHPKAVIAVDSPIDLFGLWHWCERQIRKRSVSTGDAGFILDLMTKEHGTIYKNRELYKRLSPFLAEQDTTGNEQFLKDVPVRLYYDMDVELRLKNRQSLYDTNIPDGSELVSRLSALGNSDAAFVAAKHPGMNSRGIRTTNSLSIVDEVECIHWIKNQLDIFDAHTWNPPYDLRIPKAWELERFAIPIEFAPEIKYRGVEDVRFAPGWGDEKSDQYWTYAYLWWLEGNQQINAANLEKNLKAYYEGLVGRNISSRKIPAAKVVPTTATFKYMKTEEGEAGTFLGTITMLDYMAVKPIVLHCEVHVRTCGPQNRTAVFIAISPRMYTHDIWKELRKINSSFECSK